MPSDIVRLSGLKQVLSILELLSDERTKENVVALCGGDERCVSAWVSFLKDVGWLIENEDGKFTMTEKGRDRLGNMEIHA